MAISSEVFGLLGGTGGGLGVPIPARRPGSISLSGGLFSPFDRLLAAQVTDRPPRTIGQSTDRQTIFVTPVCRRSLLRLNDAGMPATKSSSI